MSVDVSSDALARGVTPATPRVGWLAWSLTLVDLLVAGPLIYLETANGPTSLGNNILSAAILLVFAGMGSLIASRRPRNSVGWLLSFVALLGFTGAFCLEYGVAGLVRHPGSLPGAAWAALYGDVGRSISWFYLVALIPLYFPDGKLLSPRWRWIIWAIAAASLAMLVGELLGQTFSDTDLRLVGARNPIGIAPQAVADSIYQLATLAFFVILLCVACSVVLRFRRARGVERQQLKWFVYAMALTALGGFLLGAVSIFSDTITLSGAIWYLVTVGIPIATGIAILRYRLYDIDIIIKRTLVYGLLTLILAALYFALVIGAQQLTGLLTGERVGQQVGQQPIVIVLTTLLVAALFQPLRARLQRWIDRRFYRSRYDAAKTVAAFSASLRSEVDLAQLNEHLLAVVEETMRPAHASLWLRAAPGAAPSGEGASGHVSG